MKLTVEPTTKELALLLRVCSALGLHTELDLPEQVEVYNGGQLLGTGKLLRVVEAADGLIEADVDIEHSKIRVPLEWLEVD